MDTQAPNDDNASKPVKSGPKRWIIKADGQVVLRTDDPVKREKKIDQLIMAETVSIVETDNVERVELTRRKEPHEKNYKMQAKKI